MEIISVAPLEEIMRVFDCQKICRLYVLVWIIFTALLIIWQVHENCFRMICTGIDVAIDSRDMDIPWEVTKEKLYHPLSFRTTFKYMISIWVTGLPVFYAWVARPFEDNGFFRKHPRLAGYGAGIGTVLLASIALLMALASINPFHNDVDGTEGHFSKNPIQDASFLYRLSEETVEGGKYDLSQLKGKTVLLDFWTSWCQPCRESFGLLRSFEQDFEKRDDFALVTVSLDENRDNAKATVEKYQIPGVRLFNSGWDNKSSLVSSFGVDGVPFTVIITKDGKWYRVKLDSPRAMGKHMSELLRQPLPGK